MKLLLDTHVWVWSILQPRRLSRKATAALSRTTNELWISPVSLSEALVLSRKGKLALRPDARTWVRNAIAQMALREAPLTNDVALAIAEISLPHNDPADELIAATAKAYGLTLMTADERLLAGRGYPVFPAK